MIPHLNVAGNCTKEIDVIELFMRLRTLPGNIKSGQLSGKPTEGMEGPSKRVQWLIFCRRENLETTKNNFGGRQAFSLGESAIGKGAWRIFDRINADDTQINNILSGRGTSSLAHEIVVCIFRPSATR